MEENNSNKELDIFTKKYIKELEVSTPSVDFTKSILLNLEKSKEVYKATPLISKKMWFFLTGMMVIAIVYVSRGATSLAFTMPEINLDFLTPIQTFFSTKTIHISHTTAYISCLFSVMVLVQIYILKGYFTKKLDL